MDELSFFRPFYYLFNKDGFVIHAVLHTMGCRSITDAPRQQAPFKFIIFRSGSSSGNIIIIDLNV